MTDPNFERSLRAAARRGRPGGVHPDASLLAAYVDRGLSDTERAELEAHVADCYECMERLALLGSVNVPDEPEVPSFEWSPRQLLSRWGWLVPVATVVVLVAVWERQPSRPASSAPTSPAAPAVQKQVPPPPNAAEDEANERSVLPPEERQREPDFGAGACASSGRSAEGEGRLGRGRSCRQAPVNVRRAARRRRQAVQPPTSSRCATRRRSTPSARRRRTKSRRRRRRHAAAAEAGPDGGCGIRRGARG